MSHIAIDIRGDVAVATLARPPVNAVTQAIYGEIRDAFTQLAQRYPEAKVAVLRSEGSNFCAGNDLGEFLTLTPGNSAERMQAVREAFWAVHDCPLPVVAAVQGAALGTGLCLAASSDVVVCSKEAVFGLPEVSVGVMGGARHLARLVPAQIVRRVFLTSDPISASEMASFGGVSAVVERDELDTHALWLANRIARHGRAAILVAKRALNQIEHLDLKSGYELEQGYTGDLAGHPDSLEARLAAKEKRAPQFGPTSRS